MRAFSQRIVPVYLTTVNGKLRRLQHIVTKMKETKIIEQYQNKFMAEWQKFKYDILSWEKDHPKISSPVPKERRNNQQIRENENVRKITATEWSLERLVIMQHEYDHHYKEFAQIVLCAPITPKLG